MERTPKLVKTVEAPQTPQKPRIEPGAARRAAAHDHKTRDRARKLEQFAKAGGAGTAGLLRRWGKSEEFLLSVLARYDSRATRLLQLLNDAGRVEKTEAQVAVLRGEMEELRKELRTSQVLAFGRAVRSIADIPFMTEG